MEAEIGQSCSGNEECFLAATDWGRRFIESIAEEIDLIKNLKDRYSIVYREDGKTSLSVENCEHEWFTSCVDIVARGAGEGDPALLYIAAELKSYISTCDSDAGDMIACSKDTVFDSYTAPQLYSLSADAGFPHALLWCAYCLDKGAGGFEKSPDRSAEYLRSYMETELKPHSFILNELHFMKDEIETIRRMESDAEYDENMIAGACDFDYAKCIDTLPNPGERTLGDRLDELIEFYIGLGLTYECDWENFRYGDEYSERVRHIRNIKMDVWGRFLGRPKTHF